MTRFHRGESSIVFVYLSHHKKNRVVKYDFIRLEETVSRHFNAILNAMMTLHDELYAKPEPINKGCLDNIWRYFQVKNYILDDYNYQMSIN